MDTFALLVTTGDAQGADVLHRQMLEGRAHELGQRSRPQTGASRQQQQSKKSTGAKAVGKNKK